MPVIGDCVGLTLERIVFATDFSKGSESASRCAEALARHFAAEVTITHVVDESVAGHLSSALIGMNDSELQKFSLESLELQRLALFSSTTKAQSKLLVSADPAEALCTFAQNLHADVIMCGTSARRDLERAVLGSFAEHLILSASMPVITVGPGAKVWRDNHLEINTILFATDLQNNSAARAQFALKFAKEFRAKIYFCHVLKRERYELASLLGMRRKFEADLQALIPEAEFEWCSPESVVGQGLASEYIAQTAQNIGADLIVLGPSHRALWSTHARAGTTGRVLSNASCPVMTLK